ncbi:MAG: hypothetical protein ACOY4D_03640 [Pseudomonadota bacterium]
MRPAPQDAAPLWLRIVAWLARMAFVVVLLAWLGRSFVLLMDGKEDIYTAFQQGLVLVPDTLALMWRAILDFIAPLRERLFPAQPVFIGPDEDALRSTPVEGNVPMLDWHLSAKVVQPCLWIAGTQAAATLWALVARDGAARMWNGPGTLAVLEPRARVIFYCLPLGVAGFAIHRAWQDSLGDALLIGAVVLCLRLFPWLTGLPFWIMEEVIGLDFAALRTLSFLPRTRRLLDKPGTRSAETPLPNYETALAMLGLKPDCTAEDALEAYRASLRVHHAGRGGSNEQLKQLNAAFEQIKRARGWV